MISIIVPVYQSVLYISACIQSVLRQTYSNFELILVDDGSTDQTRELCQEFKASDSRIRFLPRQHRGVSAARNAGIKEAVGEYLFFLDSDDVIHPELLEALCRCAKKTGAEILGCDYNCIESADFEKYVENIKDNDILEKCIYMDNSETLEWFFGGRGEKRLLAIGGKFIRRDVAESVWFDESLSNGEDTKYIYQLIAGGADICIMCEPWYYYRRREGNASRVQTLEAYKSLYRAEQYIRNMEWKSGRTSNAVKEEYVLARRISDWYVASWRAHDKERTAYLKNLAESERTLKLWRQLSLGTRAEFWLAFFCPLLHSPCCCLLKTMLRRREKTAG